MSYQTNIYKDRWKISQPNFNNIVTESVLSLFNTYDMTYEDYIGIYHQIMAIELGYVKL